MGNTLVPLSDLEYFSKILSLEISEKDHEIEQNSILSIRQSRGRRHVLILPVSCA